MEVPCIIDPDIDIPSLLDALTHSSQAVPDAKIDSTRPSATFEIGVFAGHFISDMTADHIKYRLVWAPGGVLAATFSTAACFNFVHRLILYVCTIPTYQIQIHLETHI